MEDEDEDIFECSKFDECGSCKHRYIETTCDDCGYGEEFELEDYDEVDKHFQGRI